MAVSAKFLLGTSTVVVKVGLLLYFDFLLEKLLEFIINFLIYLPSKLNCAF